MTFGIRARLLLGFLFFILLIIAISFYVLLVSHYELYNTTGRSSIFLVEEILEQIINNIYTKI